MKLNKIEIFIFTFRFAPSLLKKLIKFPDENIKFLKQHPIYVFLK